MTDGERVEAIAAFIGARLQHPRPECNGRNPRVSTIKVDQYKSKFGYVRIYARLADPEEVLKARAERPGDLGMLSPEDAHARCLKHDARHYRRCYLDMVNLVPELYGKVCSQADYHELLFPTYEELAAWLVANELNPTIGVNYDSFAFMRSHCGVQTNDELKEFLRVIYDEQGTPRGV